MFIDYAKAFDTVDHDALWTTLKEFGVQPHLIWLLKRLYDETKGVIQVGNDHTAPFSFEKGFRQGCSLSTPLIIICGEKIMRLVKKSMRMYRRWSCNMEFALC